METPGKLVSRPPVALAVRLCLAAGVLGLLSACPALPAESPVPASRSPAPNAPQPEQAAPTPLTPAEQAQAYAQDAQVRFDNPVKHPGLNAYSEIIKLPAAEYGTTALYDLYRKKGAQALFEAVDGKAGEKLEPFIAQVKKVESLLRYQYLAVPVELPSSGPAVNAEDTRFMDVLKGVALAPVLDAHSRSQRPNTEPGLEYPVLTLRVGRKVSFHATRLQHLELGVVLQMEALSVLRKLVKDRVFDLQELGRLIGAIQSLDGNERDFQRFADGEYLLAVRRYENQGLGDSQLSHELNGLAARHLKLRSNFEKHGLEPEDVAKSVPEAAGCQLVPKEQDLLGSYDRWRASVTGASALETQAALELHKLEKKSYPEQLSSLVPRYLPRVPPDYFSKDGQFRYRRDGDGYRLETLSAKIPGHREGIYRW